MNPVPTIGRIVLYCLTDAEAMQINRRRTTGTAIVQGLDAGSWPAGAQAHIGNTVAGGDVFPAMVVRVWDDNCINIQVMLDGCDTFWATSVSVSDNPIPGMFHWMPYQKAKAEERT